jgi:hypothetical protein
MTILFVVIVVVGAILVWWLRTVKPSAKFDLPFAANYRLAAMLLVCPICKSPAQEPDRTGDATGFHCTSHGHFKVADTIADDEYYTRVEWEAALRAAKHKAMEGEWPVIRRRDFFR